MSEDTEELEATTTLKHKGQWLKDGDPFKTDASNAADLIALGFAKRRTLATRAMSAVVEAVETITQPTRRRGSSRQYQRRDLEAEGSNHADET